MKPVFRKDARDEKENCRQVSILSSLSKVIKICIHKQMPYFDKIFSKYQCSFRKNYSAQQHLIAMIGKLRQFSDIVTEALFF